MNLILISGPSGSGKTTLSLKLSKELKNSHVLNTDNYYKTGIFSKLASILINSYFDKFISHNKELITEDINNILVNKKINHYYKYNFKKKTKLKVFKEFLDIDNLILEGIFCLKLLDYLEKYNYLLIRLKTNKDICFKRILVRDQLERGKTLKESKNNFNNAWRIYSKGEKDFFHKNKKRELVFTSEPNIKIILDILSKLNL